MSKIINEGSYEQGFEIGYKAVKGKLAGLPILPIQPITKIGMTEFLMGVRKGIEKATGHPL